MAPIYFILLLCSLVSAQRRREDVSNVGHSAGVSGDSSSSSGLRGVDLSSSGLSSASGLRGSLEGLHQGHLASGSERSGVKSDKNVLHALNSLSRLIHSGGSESAVDAYRSHDVESSLYSSSGSSSADGLSGVSGHRSEGSGADRYGSGSGVGDASGLTGHGLTNALGHLRGASELGGLRGQAGSSSALGGLSDRLGSSGSSSRDVSLVGLNLPVHDHNLMSEEDYDVTSRSGRFRPSRPSFNFPQRARPTNYRPRLPTSFGSKYPQRPGPYRAGGSSYGSNAGLGDSAGSSYSNLGETAVSYRGQGVDTPSGLDHDAVAGLAGALDGYNALVGSSALGRAESGLNGLHGVSGAGYGGASSYGYDSGLRGAVNVNSGHGLDADSALALHEDLSSLSGSSGLGYSGLAGLHVE